jgi:hypothetical protein
MIVKKKNMFMLKKYINKKLNLDLKKNIFTQEFKSLKIL